MRSMSIQNEWKNYKRYSDNRIVMARLVKSEFGTAWIEIKESRTGALCCPSCSETLTQVGAETFPNFYLEPKVFHDKHKPA